MKYSMLTYSCIALAAAFLVSELPSVSYAQESKPASQPAPPKPHNESSTRNNEFVCKDTGTYGSPAKAKECQCCEAWTGTHNPGQPGHSGSCPKIKKDGKTLPGCKAAASGGTVTGCTKDGEMNGDASKPPSPKPSGTPNSPCVDTKTPLSPIEGDIIGDVIGGYYPGLH